MDRIKILVIDCQRTIFLGFLFATAKKCLWGNMHTLLDSGIVEDYFWDKISVCHSQKYSVHVWGKNTLFMKIKYFSQLCEQLHVNQFLHNFQQNEQIFDQLKLN